MKLQWAWMWISVAAAIFFLYDAASLYSRLPAQLAVHFDAAGKPDGWGTRQDIFNSVMAVFGFVAALCLGLPWLVRILPASMVNVPNAEYWHAPERSDLMQEWMFHRVGWIMCATMLLCVGMCDAILRANLEAPPQLSGFLLYISLYFGFVGFVALWLAECIWCFSLPKQVGPKQAGASIGSAEKIP